MTTAAGRTTIVVPTIGRPSLVALLESLARTVGDDRPAVVVVDDRADGDPLVLPSALAGGFDLTVARSVGGGPARARNVGWRHARTPWVSFLDDDVEVEPDWWTRLGDDLSAAAPGTAGVQGRVHVPLPAGRRPTDWERGTAGLEGAPWITADLSYRRDALSAVGGFDERFPRAFREDADLGLRITERCGPITAGTRRIRHPVRPADRWASLRQQRGNADDFLMRALHGRAWHARTGSLRGRRPRHVATSVAAVASLTALAAGHRRSGLAAAALWLSGTAEFALARIRPGPRDRQEVGRMLVTSALIPFSATWHSAYGLWRHRPRRVRPWTGVPELVLFDRDGTLVHDVPYNGDPAAVRPVADALAALDRLREAGVRVGIVTNQAGVADGRLTLAAVEAVNAEVVRRLGPFDVVETCPHDRSGDCGCRKPRPGMVLAACARLGVPPQRCAVVGDIGADVEAGRVAGGVGVLVPTGQTRPEEIDGLRAGSLGEAVELLLRGHR